MPFVNLILPGYLFGSVRRVPRTRRVCLSEDPNSEIILSGGAIFSPWLLFNSGIGPVEEIKKLGVDLIQSVPDMGKHIRDRPCVPVGFFLNDDQLPRFPAQSESTALWMSSVKERFEGGDSSDIEKCYANTTDPDCSMSFVEEFGGGRMVEGAAIASRSPFHPDLRGAFVSEMLMTVRTWIVSTDLSSQGLFSR